MFDTIVWATDGSEPADATLPLVTELAGVHRSRIVAVHVVELFAGGRFAGGTLQADADEVESKIAGQVDDLRAAGFETSLDVVRTTRHATAALIAEAATRAGADLIVVGTHGHHTPAALLRAGVSGGLEHTASCPVLAVPLAEHQPRELVATGAPAMSVGDR